ncbi:MAG: hypothetical protein M1538_02330 [Candidatus Marsarchaeota archaeon]|jgi:translin|nr:hypothetical protein [Candidatus Marsarchaeota archaeon]
MKNTEKFDELYRDVEHITLYLEKKQETLDKIIQITRNIIRDSGHTITLIHNDEIFKAEELIKKINEEVNALKNIDNEFKYNTIQAYQEYVEALSFLSIIKTNKLPMMKDLNVSDEAYLLGIMDVVGELKRKIIELLRTEKVGEAKEMLSIMEAIYDSTRKLKFAESVLQGFRKKQDVARIQIESASSQLLFFENTKFIDVDNTEH